jgi:preprotein translocase subunit SecE
MNTLATYIRDTRDELAHVTWPTRKQAFAYTIIVIIVSLFTAFFLGFFDYLFTLIIQKFVL